VIYTNVTNAPRNRRTERTTSNRMKRSGWAPGRARTSSVRKKARAMTVNQILKDAYRLYARDRASQKAVKHCLG